VATVDLVGLEVESLSGVAARPGGREHAVVAAEEVFRRHVRPKLSRVLSRMGLRALG